MSKQDARPTIPTQVDNTLFIAQQQIRKLDEESNKKLEKV
jgi:hypothetical protein